VKIVIVAAALAVAAVPGASARSNAALQLVSFGPPVISPNGNGINDTLRVRTSAPAKLRVYGWGGRVRGWHQIRRRLDWARFPDGTYQVTACYKDRGQRLAPEIPPAQQRPGPAEATVSNPPWRWSGCLAKPRVVRVERLAAYVDSTKSYLPGSNPPLVVSADGGQATTQLVHDCSGRAHPGSALPRGLATGLYHYDVTDPAGDRFVAPVVVRNGSFPLDHPPSHTALLVWPYLSWRAYNAYDADLNGIPDSWYQFWRQRRVSVVGTLLPHGHEDDHQAVLPFSRWLCSRHPRAESITDVELRNVPLSTLRRYAAVIFPGHSEYYEPATYDLLKRYRDGGGNLVFLQANPFYRQVRLDRAHNALVMTDFDAREGRSDFELAGVGYDGCCFPRSRARPYVAAIGPDFERVRWLFRGTGIGAGQSFGHAGSESDRIDPELTPRDHVVAARAIVAGKRGVINAALVWSHAGKGQVLATGNYDFLRMGRPLTWTLLDNVWRKLVG
jgi:N,N-dimethylformamidase beta subunit-like, C-terminal